MDTHKIQVKSSSIENDNPIPVNTLSEYYKSITKEDKNQVICTDFKLKESVNVESCNSVTSNKITATNDITLGNKGK